jgi:surface protein
MLGGDGVIVIIDDDNINHLVDIYVQNKSMLPEYLRDISTWDVSRVTDMSFLFSPEKYSNKSSNKFSENKSNVKGLKDIERLDLYWNVSNVTNMSSMFRGCKKLKRIYVKTWDTSNVTLMDHMFFDCRSFVSLMYKNGNNEYSYLNNLNVSNVTDMSYMFSGLSYPSYGSVNESGWNVDFNQPLDKWDVRNVKNMSGMFKHCSRFNQNLNSWKVDNVTDMSSMFEGCEEFNKPLDKWNVGNVTNMSNMFWYTDFNQNISRWNITKIKTEVMSASIYKQIIDENDKDMEEHFAPSIDELISEDNIRLYNTMTRDRFGFIKKNNIRNKRIIQKYLDSHIELYLFYSCPIRSKYMPRIFESIHRTISRNAKLKHSIKKHELNREIENYYMPPENMKTLIKMYTLPNGDLSNDFFEHAPTTSNRKTLYKRKYGIPDKYQSPPSSVSKSI